MFKPNYTLTDKLVLQLIDLEVAKSKIESQELTGTTAAELRKDTKAINMFHMAHLLGVDLTLKDAAKAAEGKKIVTPDKRGTVLNNFRNVLEFTRADVSQYYNDVDMKILMHMNKILVTDWKELWDVKFRASQDEGDNSLDNWLQMRDNEIDPSHYQSEVVSLLDWYKSTKGTVQDVIRVGVFVYKMIRLAPFTALNKQTIIGLTDFILYRGGYTKSSYFPTARNFDQHEQEYIEAINYARQNEEDMTLFLERFSKALAHDFKDRQDRVIEKISSESKSGKQPFLDLNKRQLKILKYLQTIPTVKREDYVQMMDVSTMTAYRDLNGLVDKSLLKVEGSGRGTKYTLTTR